MEEFYFAMGYFACMHFSILFCIICHLFLFFFFVSYLAFLYVPFFFFLLPLFVVSLPLFSPALALIYPNDIVHILYHIIHDPIW